MQANLSEERNFSDKNLIVNVQVIFFNEDDMHFAYIPSSELTGYGTSNKSAIDSLTITLDEFLRYTVNKNTLLVELKRLGWKISSRRKPMVAPQMSNLINTNEQLREIVNHKNFTTSKFSVNVPEKIVEY